MTTSLINHFLIKLNKAKWAEILDRASQSGICTELDYTVNFAKVKAAALPDIYGQ